MIINGQGFNATILSFKFLIRKIILLIFSSMNKWQINIPSKERIKESNIRVAQMIMKSFHVFTNRNVPQCSAVAAFINSPLYSAASEGATIFVMINTWL